MSGAPFGTKSGPSRRHRGGGQGATRTSKQASGESGAEAAETAQPRRGKMVIERRVKATLDEVWDRWTTGAGIESWWGPDGFLTRVNRLDIRPGGGFEYATKAIEPAQIEALKSAGLPMTSVGHVTYTEAEPLARLGYKVLVDYIKEVAPYEVSTLVELKKVPGGVVMVVTQDEMHNSDWTQMAAMGLDRQINRLVEVLSGPPQE